MKKATYIACATLGVLLAGCGGGGSNAGTCYGGAEVCSYGQDSSVSAPTFQTASTNTICGYVVNSQTLQGEVISVHDGDTIRISADGSSLSIRLDSIDAPELAQPYGPDSQLALSSAVLGKTVTVAYGKTDKYGRVVGSVFDPSCNYVNLQQVQSGMAWYYKAYQCEIPAAARTLFAQAQEAASTAKIGLWAQSDPEAPWYYRNGTEPATPTCTSDLPGWFDSEAMGTTGSNYSTGSTTGGSGGSTAACYVGPRGGTYTITSNGNKNYGGC